MCWVGRVAAGPTRRVRPVRWAASLPYVRSWPEGWSDYARIRHPSSVTSRNCPESDADPTGRTLIRLCRSADVDAAGRADLPMAEITVISDERAVTRTCAIRAAMSGRALIRVVRTVGGFMSAILNQVAGPASSSSCRWTSRRSRALRGPSLRARVGGWVAVRCWVWPSKRRVVLGFIDS